MPGREGALPDGRGIELLAMRRAPSRLPNAPLDFDVGKGQLDASAVRRESSGDASGQADGLSRAQRSVCREIDLEPVDDPCARLGFECLTSDGGHRCAGYGSITGADR